MQSNLYQKPFYRTQNRWFSSFPEALKATSPPLAIDTVSLLSYLSFNSPGLGRTNVKQIQRRPWLSSITNSGDTVSDPIPPHDFYWLPYQEIAAKLKEMIYREVLAACRGKQVYCLLSGGLDSRIVALTVSRLHHEEQLQGIPTGITWGLENSRDVVYGRQVAKALGFRWIHLPIGPEHLLENLSFGARELGGLVSPLHWHCIPWFAQLQKEAVVLAGTWGGTIGRGEYLGSSLLEEKHLKLNNFEGILLPEVYAETKSKLITDSQQLYQRIGQRPVYAQREIENQAFYISSGVGLILSWIGVHCTLYQIYTSAEICSFIWSLHPLKRNVNIYRALLEQIGEKVKSIPWSHTNRTVSGGKAGDPNLSQMYHRYAEWISGPLSKTLHERLDFNWFSQTRIFNTAIIKNMAKEIQSPSYKILKYGYRYYDIFLWLIGLCEFQRFAKAEKKEICPEESLRPPAKTITPRKNFRSFLKNIWIIRFLFLGKRLMNNLRLLRLFLIAYFIYPKKKS